MKNIVNTDCQMGIYMLEQEMGGVVTINSQPSTNVKADGKFIYKSPLSVTVSNYEDTNIAQGTGTGVINSSATKTKNNTSMVMLEGDSGTVILSGVHPISGAPVTGYEVTVKIKGAGQSKVTAA